MSKSIIKFKNVETDLELDLSIISYQYPSISSGWDANWLIVKIECRYQGKVFKKQDPSLTTHDVFKILKWFQSIGRNTLPKCTYLAFIEPNLEFQLFRNDNGIIRFGIKLDAESRPPFNINELTVEPDDLEQECILMFESSFKEMNAYAISFQRFVADFPFRGEC